MLDNFKEASKGDGAVLLGVCGGRNSEGEANINKSLYN